MLLIDHLLGAHGCHDAYVVVIHLAEARIQAAKNKSFLVHAANMF